jgi:rhamnosyltransferase
VDSREATGTGTRVSVIVPTLNPGENLYDLRDALERQRLRPLEVIILDSASTDKSPERWRAAGYRVFHIERAAFNHGRTRNLGARRSQGDILVFMVQDAVPVDEYCLTNLIAPIVSGQVVGTFARQLPKKDANLLERFARSFNYPAESHVRKRADVHELGFRAFFFSNVCSAVRADVFWEVGGFPEEVIVNEDVLLCAKLLRAGYEVKYDAKARVYHSHHYGLLQYFKRYFDIGAFMSQAGSYLQEARVGTEGLNFVMGQANYVIQQGEYISLFRVISEAAVKLLAYHLGKRERGMARFLKRRLSMHSSFW